MRDPQYRPGVPGALSRHGGASGPTTEPRAIRQPPPVPPGVNAPQPQRVAQRQPAPIPHTAQPMVRQPPPVRPGVNAPQPRPVAQRQPAPIPHAVPPVMAGRVMGSGAAAGVPPRTLSETRKATPPHSTAIQRQPAAAGYPGDDEDFLQEVLRLRIVPIRVRMRDESGGTLYMIDFPAAYQYQIHIHEAATGQINGAHIKSNAGNIRHSMNYVDAINYLEVLNQLHSQNQMEIRQDD